MIIDFKEIEQANKGGGLQDQFEFFAREFLESLGYITLRFPDRGADGKKDLIVNEIRSGIDGNTNIKWLVSCKHYAHSGKSVSDSDEQDILDRVNAHKCHGFIGVYSTLPSSSLSNKLYGYNDIIPHIIYDSSMIEQRILNNEQLFFRYFPKSYNSYCNSSIQNQAFKDDSNEKTLTTSFTEEDLLRINKTALIIVELAELQERYWNVDWLSRDEIIKQLHRYIDHINIHITQEVYSFLAEVASMTRSNMPYSTGHTIYSNILNFFPRFQDKEDLDKKIQIAKESIFIGFNIAYDSFIHLRNLAIATWGLLAIKFIYTTAKQFKQEQILQEVISQYDKLEETLKRPERKDLINAQKLMSIFRKDLNSSAQGFPELPTYLWQIFFRDEKK